MIKRVCIHLLALAAGLLVLVPAASATDGTVLINQATALHGLPGCAPQGGVLITICQSGSYRLSGNLTLINESGIEIDASDVTLDLNGFTIAGDGTTSEGVILGGSRITIENGEIRSFLYGIDGIVQETDGDTVRSMSLMNNAGNALELTGSVQVTDCTVADNVHYGIAILPDANASSVIGTLITNNQVGLFDPVSGAGMGYGHDTLMNNNGGADVRGGTSMGDNACSSGPC